MIYHCRRRRGPQSKSGVRGPVSRDVHISCSSVKQGLSPRHITAQMLHATRLGIMRIMRSCCRRLHPLACQDCEAVRTSGGLPWWHELSRPSLLVMDYLRRTC